jgi:excisionase family DNA binding protein
LCKKHKVPGKGIARFPDQSLYEQLGLVNLTALTVSEVAEILNISERHVYKLASLSIIPSFRVGSSIRFDPSQVAAWLRQKAGPLSVRPGEERRKRA